MSDDKEARSNRLLMRTILFVVVNGPTTLLTLSLWVRIGARISKHTAASGDNRMMTLMFAVWLIGIAGSAFAIFKK